MLTKGPVVGSQILVDVEDCKANILVVSYKNKEGRTFQGVLIDTSNVGYNVEFDRKADQVDTNSTSATVFRHSYGCASRCENNNNNDNSNDQWESKGSNGATSEQRTIRILKGERPHKLRPRLKIIQPISGQQRVSNNHPTSQQSSTVAPDEQSTDAIADHGSRAKVTSPYSRTTRDRKRSRCKNGSGCCGSDSHCQGGARADSSADDSPDVVDDKRNPYPVLMKALTPILSHSASQKLEKIRISLSSNGHGKVIKPNSFHNFHAASPVEEHNVSTTLSRRPGPKCAQLGRPRIHPITTEPGPVERRRIGRPRKHVLPSREEEGLTGDDVPSASAFCSDDLVEDDMLRDLCLRQRLTVSLTRFNTPVNGVGVDKEANERKCNKPKSIAPRYVPKRSTVTPQGQLVAVGDIVWGKVPGFPWWPGSVLNLTELQRGSRVVRQKVRVDWLGTVDHWADLEIGSVLPFVEYFQAKHIKRKQGRYRRAINEALNVCCNGTATGKPLVMSDDSQSVASNDSLELD